MDSLIYLKTKMKAVLAQAREAKLRRRPTTQLRATAMALIRQCKALAASPDVKAEATRTYKEFRSKIQSIGL